MDNDLQMMVKQAMEKDFWVWSKEDDDIFSPRDFEIRVLNDSLLIDFESLKLFDPVNTLKLYSNQLSSISEQIKKNKSELLKMYNHNATREKYEAHPVTKIYDNTEEYRKIYVQLDLKYSKVIKFYKEENIRLRQLLEDKL